MPSLLQFVKAVRIVWASTVNEVPDFTKAPAFTKATRLASRSPIQWWIAFDVGVNLAIISFAWQWYLPNWIVILRFWYLTCNFALGVDRSLPQLGLSHLSRARAANLALHLAWTTVWHIWVPVNKWLILQVAVTDVLTPFVVTGIEYAVQDVPLGKEWLIFTANLDTLYGFSVVGLVLFSFNGWVRALRFLFRGIILLYWFFRVTNHCLDLPMPMKCDIELVLMSCASFGPEALIKAVDHLARLYVLPLIFVGVGCGSVVLILNPWREATVAWIRQARDSMVVFISRRYFGKGAAVIEVCECAETLLLGYTIDAIQSAIALLWKTFRWRGQPTHLYKPLRSGQIRLLRLHRSCPGILKCSLLTADIEDCPEYEAVSYHWGDAKLTEEIILDGSVRSIPQSAYRNLVLMASVWRDRMIWIDAICIDQQNIQEKSEQVRAMYNVYRKASRVVVIPSTDRRNRLVPGLLYRHVHGSQDPHAADENDIPITSADMIYSDRKNATVCLLTGEYFTRVWIIQEITAGRSTHLCLGGLYVPWEIFAQSLRDVKRHDFYLGFMMQANEWPFLLQHPYLGTVRSLIAVKRWAEAVRLNDSVLDRLPIHLDTLLFLSSMFNSTDLRDKVFALEGVVRSMRPGLEDSGLLRPDYSISADEVNENAARYLFLEKAEPSVNMLANSGNGYAGEPLARRSWIPQYSFDCRRTPLSDLSNHFLGKGPQFKASANYPAVVKPGKLRGSLLMKGKVCDNIQLMSEARVVFSKKQTKKDRLETTVGIRKFVDAAVNLCDVHKSLCSTTSNFPGTKLALALTAERIPGATWEDLCIFRQGFVDDTGYVRRLLSPTSLVQGMFNPVFMNTCPGRCFGITSRGRLCLVPNLTRSGDSVFIPLGAQTPYVIRKVDDNQDERYVLLGEAYVQGIMQGEVVHDPSHHEFVTLV